MQTWMQTVPLPSTYTYQVSTEFLDIETLIDCSKGCIESFSFLHHITQGLNNGEKLKGVSTPLLP